jgi:hypothetical protein
MGLGERCDEIVRLIDETLADLGLDPAPEQRAAVAAGPGPATVTPLAPSPGSRADRRRRQPPAGPHPDRTAAGF